MAIKNYKPTSPGRRGASVSTYEEITCTKPEKSLLAVTHMVVSLFVTSVAVTSRRSD